MALTFWRIGTSAFPVWSSEGARLSGGRWNRAGLPAIYAGTSCAIGVLEIIAHAAGPRPPSASRYVVATAPDTIAVEHSDVTRIPGWDDLDDPKAAQAFGSQWLEEQRSAILYVPSVVTQGQDWNVVINPLHPHYAQITAAAEVPLTFDPRLFG